MGTWEYRSFRDAPISRIRGPAAPPKKPCNYWRKDGACPFGDGCWYGHEEGDKGILLLSAALDGKHDDDAPMSPTQSIASSEGSWRKTNTNTPFNSVKQYTLRDLGRDGKDTFGSTTSKYTLSQTATPISPADSASNWRKAPGDPIWRRGGADFGQRQPSIQKEAIDDEEQEEKAKARLYRENEKKMALEDEEERRRKEQVAREEEEVREMVERWRKENVERERKEAEERRRMEEAEKESERERREAEMRRMLEEEEEREREEIEARRKQVEDSARLRNEERLAREKAIIEAARRRHQEQQRSQWKTESASVETHVVADTNLVVFTAGMNVRQVVSGFDLCRITVKDLSTDATAGEIVNFFRQQGFSSSEYLFTNLTEAQGKREAIVVAAREAVDRCLIAGEERGSPIKFRDGNFRFEVSRNASGDEMTIAAETQTFLKLSWSAPSTMIVAIYDSTEQAQAQVQRLNGKLWNGRHMSASKVDGLVGHVASRLAPSAVVLCCAPGTAPSSDFCSFLGTNYVNLLSSAVYNSTEVYRLVREHFRQLPGVQMDTYEELDVKDENTDATIKIGFSTWKEAKQAHDTMNEKRLKDNVNFPLIRSVLLRPIQYSIKIPKPQFLVQKVQWVELSSAQEKANLKFEDQGDVFIHVTGYSIMAAGSLKVRIERLAAGERLDATQWHSSFSEQEGKDFLECILKEKNVYVRNDITRQRLSLCGDRRAFNEVKRMIGNKVGHLTFLNTTVTLDPEYIREFMTVGWEKLKELVGQGDVAVDVAPTLLHATVTVRGRRGAHHLQRLVDEARLTFLDPNDTDMEFCSLCEEPTSIPEKLGCGHSYCPCCISQFLTSATNTGHRSFPLVCQGNEGACQVPIPIPFIRRFLYPQLFENLVEAAFIAYLDKKPQELQC